MIHYTPCNNRSLVNCRKSTISMNLLPFCSKIYTDIYVNTFQTCAPNMVKLGFLKTANFMVKRYDKTISTHPACMATKGKTATLVYHVHIRSPIRGLGPYRSTSTLKMALNRWIRGKTDSARCFYTHAGVGIPIDRRIFSNQTV